MRPSFMVYGFSIELNATTFPVPLISAEDSAARYIATALPDSSIITPPDDPVTNPVSARIKESYTVLTLLQEAIATSSKVQAV